MVFSGYECSSPSVLPSSLYTPASKGNPYGSDLAEASLGQCYYFVAPVECSLGSTDLPICPSPNRKITSSAGPELSFQYYPINRSIDPMVQFKIGVLSYQWNTRHNTLSTLPYPSGQLRTSSSVPESSLSNVQLYASLEDAKALVDLLCFDELSVESLGDHFVAPFKPARGPGFAVFSLIPECRIISFMDANSSFHPYHVDLSFDSIIHSPIEGLRQLWGTRHGTVSTPSTANLGAGPSVLAPELSNLQLYANLEEATYVDIPQFYDLTVQDYLGLDASSSSLTNSNSSTPLAVAGISSTFNSPQLFDSFELGVLVPFPSQEDIDQWVDKSVARHQTTRDRTYLNCPEPGCTHAARRPHALKTHLYTHYGIKPHTCTMCGISVLTEANRRRHIKTAHTCSVCGFVGSISTIKSHKAVCLSATGSPGPTRGKPNRPSSFGITPYLNF
ncbi:unnamed protein product [Rhizoctonia solani]|uniref:C2H2-type domain-containing protein n=1 Tax=Rhizoctonia solani TaxID=456999 RepID=A0A8H3CGC1_9AGAM|nr:unnamed protein product [Rhizoctonia solani]